jgi:hypothetical protein
MEPQLVADVRLYPAGTSHRKGPIHDRHKTLCCVLKGKPPVSGWDCMMLLGEPPLPLGETRHGVGFVFLSGQKAADIMRASGTFYLWELGFYGEATVAQVKL